MCMVASAITCTMADTVRPPAPGASNSVGVGADRARIRRVILRQLLQPLDGDLLAVVMEEAAAGPCSEAIELPSRRGGCTDVLE